MSEDDHLPPPPHEEWMAIEDGPMDKGGMRPVTLTPEEQQRVFRRRVFDDAWGFLYWGGAPDDLRAVIEKIVSLAEGARARRASE